MSAPTLRFGEGGGLSHADARRCGEWEKKQFSKVFSFLRNNTLSRDRLSQSSGSVKNIHYGDILVVFPSLIDPAAPIVPFVADERDVRGQTRLRPGDVVIADTAEDETVGRAVEITGGDSLDVVAGLHTMPCRPADTFASGFLGYSLNSPGFHDQLLPLIQGSKVSSISKGAIGDVFIRYPAALHEQRKIGSFFRSLDALIDGREKALGKLEALKKAMLQKMFPQGDAKMPEVRFKGFKGEWNISPFDDVFQHVPSKGYQIQSHEYLDVGLYPVVDQGQTSIVGYSNNSDKICRAKNNPVIVFGDHTRIVKFVDFDFVVGADGTQLLRAAAHDLSFLAEVIRGLPLPNMGYSRHFKFLQESVFRLPSLPEQQKIGAYFRSLDALVIARREEVCKLRDLKKALLERMFA